MSADPDREIRLAFIAITTGAARANIAFTVAITEWRMEIRRAVKEIDSAANTRAIDSLLNYETVKYFGNEEFEARRYDEQLHSTRTRPPRTRPRSASSTSARA